MVIRATLIKATVASIPIYAMQTTLLPQKISHQIDSMSCKFSQRRGCHTVNWETVTLLRVVRGLGIPSTRHQNSAILMNQACRLYTNPNMLWAKVLKAKYFPTQPFLLVIAMHEGHIYGNHFC